MKYLKKCFYCSAESPAKVTPCRTCGRELVGSSLTDPDILALEDEVKAEISIGGKVLEGAGEKWTGEVIMAWKLAEDTYRRLRLRLVGATDDYGLT